MDTSLVLAIFAGLGLLGAVGAGGKAYLERKLIQANASNQNATATSVVVEAARELVDPLRKELYEERQARDRERLLHSREVDLEQHKVTSLRRDLDEVQALADRLEAQLRQANLDVEMLRGKLLEVQKENEYLRGLIHQQDN